MTDFDDLNLHISLILAILILMCNLNSILPVRVEHEKGFIASGVVKNLMTLFS